MFNYEDYLTQPDALRLEEALALYNRIAPAAHRADADFTALWRDLLDAATRYVNVRNQWGMMDQATRLASDASRTRTHNAYMSALAPVARYMTSRGEDGSWLAVLGDRANHRKRWGDFAGYLVLFGNLAAR